MRFRWGLNETRDYVHFGIMVLLTVYWAITLLMGAPISLLLIGGLGLGVFALSVILFPPRDTVDDTAEKDREKQGR